MSDDPRIQELQSHLAAVTAERDRFMALLDVIGQSRESAGIVVDLENRPGGGYRIAVAGPDEAEVVDILSRTAKSLATLANSMHSGDKDALRRENGILRDTLARQTVTLAQLREACRRWREGAR